MKKNIKKLQFIKNKINKEYNLEKWGEIKMENSKKKIGLTSKIFIALILGAICGVILHYLVPAGNFKDELLINGVFYIVGNGFLRLMQMLVVPLVFCSLVCGASAIGDTKTLGKVGVKTIGFYLVTTALAITVALSVGKLMNPGIGLDISAIEKGEATIAEATNLADTLLNIIPKNPIQGLAEGNMLQIILFAIINGFSERTLISTLPIKLITAIFLLLHS